jgi:hypothetical protein
MAFSQELPEWLSRKDMTATLTVDAPVPTGRTRSDLFRTCSGRCIPRPKTALP